MRGNGDKHEPRRNKGRADLEAMTWKEQQKGDEQAHRLRRADRLDDVVGIPRRPLDEVIFVNKAMRKSRGREEKHENNSLPDRHRGVTSTALHFHPSSVERNVKIKKNEGWC